MLIARDILDLITTIEELRMNILYMLYGKDQTTIYPEQTGKRNKKITNYIYKTILKEHYIIYIIVFLYIYPNMATKILINGQNATDLEILEI